MPWAIFNRPSIQLGALKSYIRANASDIAVAAFHPYLDAAEYIGTSAYRIISENGWAGESLYCALLFPEMRDRARSVFSRSLGKNTAAALPDFDLLCEQLDIHLDTWLEKNDFSSTDLIGFSVCFGQLPATLLAAERLKRKHPQLKTVLGGSTCVPEIAASLLQVFKCIDYVVAGEGEQPLLGLCRFLQGRTDSEGPGTISQQHAADSDKARPSFSSGAEVKDLNALPAPDYDDYFAELQRSGMGFIPQIPLEFSRGCWWNKCAFCNLNLQWCGYRFKKSERMQKEVELMAVRYRCLDISFTDNALPPAEAEHFFAAMPQSSRDIRFFAEIRTVNKPDQYALFKRGGLDSVQIGIEAFSDSLLKRMNKGATAMDNLAAMKYCTEAGIQLDGNLILEFPGSTEDEVRETLSVLEFAFPFHPLSAAGFFLGHGSPVWNDPKQYGVKAIRHHPFNRQLYPASILSRLELLIKQGTGDRTYQRKLWQPVRKRLREWSAFHKGRIIKDRPALSYRNGGDFIIIRQELPGKPTRHHRLTGISAQIYLACRSPFSIKSLLLDFNSITEKALVAFLDDLEGKKLIFRDRDIYLALAAEYKAGR